MEWAADYIRAMTGKQAIEVAAVMLGLANVALLIRRSIWNYPFGLAMVMLYALIFFESKLYADAGLQVFFFAIQTYGWLTWRRARDGEGLVIVRRAGPRNGGFLVAALAGAGLLGAALDRWTDATHPYWDAAIASFSIAAQVMMAKRYLENWLVWIAADALAIGLFWAKGLHATAALYATFLIMCVIGFTGWRRSLIAEGRTR